MNMLHGTHSDAAQEIARIIKGVIFDGDGVLTDNCVLEGLQGAKPRWRSHYDGQGISLLRAIGLKICFITNESGVGAEAIRSLVERWNSLPSTEKEGSKGGWSKVTLVEDSAGEGKVKAAQTWMDIQGFGWKECAVMGDDLVDIPMLRLSALRAAPASAEKVVLQMADFVSFRPGGKGAIRDFANFILEMRGVDSTALPTQ